MYNERHDQNCWVFFGSVSFMIIDRYGSFFNTVVSVLYFLFCESDEKRTEYERTKDFFPRSIIFVGNVQSNLLLFPIILYFQAFLVLSSTFCVLRMEYHVSLSLSFSLSHQHTHTHLHFFVPFTCTCIIDYSRNNTCKL